MSDRTPVVRHLTSSCDQTGSHVITDICDRFVWHSECGRVMAFGIKALIVWIGLRSGVNLIIGFATQMWSQCECESAVRIEVEVIEGMFVCLAFNWFALIIEIQRNLSPDSQTIGYVSYQYHRYRVSLQLRLVPVLVKRNISLIIYKSITKLISTINT